MDNARWFVVFSAIVSMIAVLTVMSRFSADPKVLPPTSVSEISQQAIAAPEAKVELLNRGAARRKYGEIKFSKPPAHTFAVEGTDDFRQMDSFQQDSGRILQ